jgi:transmembrane sensor
LKQLVIKYLTDTLSKEELKALQDWLKLPKNQEYFKNAVRANQILDFSYTSIDKEEAYQKALGLSETNNTPIRKIFRILHKYAAVAIIAVALSIGVYSLVKKDSPDLPDSITEIASPVTLEFEDGTFQVLDENTRRSITNTLGEKVATQEFGKLVYEKSSKANLNLAYDRLKVPFGKRFELRLADGSSILLNAGSELRYPRSFTGLDSRNLFLEGEAYFDVEENQNQPFIVHTEQMNVRVFGTKFNVSNYRNEDSPTAVLTEGSIAVYDPSNTLDEQDYILIKPGQQVTAQKDGFVVREVHTEKHIAWSKDKLYFVNDRFGDIIKELERHYDIRIINKSPELDDLRYTGTFTSETLIQVMDTFKSTTYFEYQVKTDKIIIKAGAL